MFLNPFEQPGKWYKANLHTHTTMSDGIKTPEQTTQDYRRKGYNILAITDHGVCNDMSHFTRKNFLIINGTEEGAIVPGGQYGVHHIVGLGVPPGFTLTSEAYNDGNICIQAIRNAGGETILAHPYWCAHRYDHYSYLKGYVAVEVYNGTCDGNGRASSETDWSHLLDAGRIVPAVAVDDSHGHPRDSFQGWVWMKLKKLAVPDVMEALRTGCSYSSTGPRISDFRICDGKIILRCTPARTVYFMSHQPLGGVVHHAEGKPLRSISRQFPQDWKVFRAVVVDAEGRRAWTNPIILNDKQIKTLITDRVRKNRSKTYNSLSAVSGKISWHKVDLKPSANRALYGHDGGIGPGLSLHQISAGTHQIHGVPFEVLDQNACSGVSAVALKSLKLQQSAGKALPESVTIPVGRKCSAAYFLHGAGFIGGHHKLAEYVFVYDDGSRYANDVIALGTPVEDRRTMARREKVSAIQDWWPTIQQFENEHARNVVVAKEGNPGDHRYIYTMECINQYPEKTIREIVMRSAPGVSSSVVVLAVTLCSTKKRII